VSQGGRSRSYRTRLIAGALAVWVPAALLMVGAMTVLAARNALTARQALLSSVARATATDVEQWVQERQDNLVRLAGVLVPVVDDPAAMKASLLRVAQVRDVFDVLFVVDTRGVVIASTDDSLSFEPAGQEWFGRALTGQTIVSPVYRDGEEIRWMIATPVRGENGIVGVAVADLRVEAIAPLVTDLAKGAGEIRLVGPDRLLIYSTAFGSGLEGATLLAQGALDPEMPVATEGAEAALDGREGAGRYRDGGATVLAGYAPVESAEWAAVAQADVTSVLGEVARVLLVGLAALLLGAAALVAAATAFARRETRHLRELAEDSAVAGDQVLGNVASLQTASDELVAATGRQGEAVATTSASIAALSSAAAQIANSVVRVAEQAALTREGLERAEADVQRSAARTTSLVDRVDDIKAVLVSLDELADQTGLLALNAAIEAARAGESGRGFTVVADEVRRLSERSKAFAADIAGMVDETRTETAATLDAMDHGSKRLHEGLALLEDVTVVAQQVRGATTAQRATAEHGAQNMDRASDASRHVSAAAEQVAATAGDLTVLAGDLGRTATSLRERL